MRNHKIIQAIGCYSIMLGFSVLGMWGVILLTESIPEGKNEMIFHLISEFIMAVFCILSGFTLLKKKRKNLNIAAHAMVFYSVINAAGYYSEKGETITIILFIILAILSLMILAYYLFLPVRSE